MPLIPYVLPPSYLPPPPTPSSICSQILALLPPTTQQAVQFALSTGNATIIENMAKSLVRARMPIQADCLRYFASLNVPHRGE